MQSTKLEYHVTHLDSKHAVVSIISHVGPAGTPLSLPHSNPHVCQLFTNGCHAVAGLHNLVQLSLLALLCCSKLCVELPLQSIQCSASTKTSLNTFCLFSSHALQHLPAVETGFSIHQSVPGSMLRVQFARTALLQTVDFPSRWTSPAVGFSTSGLVLGVQQ